MFTEFPKTEKWVFEKLAAITFPLPPKIKVIDDQYLITASNSDKKMIRIYDLDKGKLIKNFGRKGQGPGEFVSVWNIFDDGSAAGRFWIWDGNLRRLTQYNVDKMRRSTTIKPDTMINMSADAGFPHRFICLNSDTFAAIGSLNSRLCFYNSKGDTIKTNAYIPGRKGVGTASMFHFQAYQSMLDYHFQRKKIVICNFFGDLIEIYSREGKPLKTIHGPDFFVPQYTIDQHSATHTVFRQGYTDLCLSANHIYGIYSGEKYNPKKGEWIKSFGKNIFIFDYNGQPLVSVTSELRLGRIEISAKKNILYAVCYDGEEFFIGYHQL